jgi:hypothetical protein
MAAFPFKRKSYDNVVAKIEWCLYTMAESNPCFEPSKMEYGRDVYVAADLAQFSAKYPTQGAMILKYDGMDLYESGIMVSDLIPGIEEARLSVSVNHTPSVKTMWSDERFRARVNRLAMSVTKIPIDIKPSKQRTELYKMREGVYQAASPPGEAAQFGAGKALAVYELFKPKRILDPCSGWGERMLGSIIYSARSSRSVSYVGSDPNKALQQSYNYIHDECTKAFMEIEWSGVVIPSGFENLNLGSQRFDLVFTSPSFFDKEIYSTDASQSTSKWGEFEGWFDKFLCGMFKKSWATLMPGGILAIHIQDTKTCVCVERMLDWCTSNLPGCTWHMLLGIASSSKVIRPIWCLIKA